MDDMMLIVDDTEMNRAILKVLFEKKYEIMEAENGEEALEILERCQGSIDIVLLDLSMPGMNGFDIMERRSQLDYFKNVPVVVITSSDTMQDQVRAFELGANDYIAKPFIPEIVISRVNNVMASNRRMLSIELEAQRMKIKSELDEMTGVLNKTTTEETMDSILRFSENRLQVLMIIDIDNFKTVNDTSGHQAGDHVIKIIANLISSLFRKTDVVGRVGGDEFCVLMVDVPNMEIVYAKANELIQMMRYKPNLAIPEYVTLSIGFVTNERSNSSYPVLFKKADEALYHAKQAGKAQYYEYGTEPDLAEVDERPVALVLSDNRSVCSMVHSLTPVQIRIVETIRVDQLENIHDSDRNKVQLFYVDVSDMGEDSAQFWKRLESIPWMKLDRVIAICQESNMSQYAAAIQSGVADMITTPIDSDSFKRKTLRLLEKLQILSLEPKED